MDTRKGLFILLALCLLLAVRINSVALAFDYPWTIKRTISTGMEGTRFSTTMLSSNEFPGISYLKSDGSISLCKIIGKLAPSCYSTNSSSLSIVASTLSQVQTHSYPDTFVAKWAYQPNFSDSIYIHWVELMNNTMALVDSGDVHLFNLLSGETIVGPIALALDTGGNPHAAVVLHHTDYDRLVYIYDTDTSNTSCGFDSKYQCDRISVVASPNTLSTPNIVLTSTGTPRITYILDYGTNVVMSYAYPQSGAAYDPNCGPGNNTWRCVSLFYNLNANTRMDLAMGTTQPHVVCTYPSAMGDHPMIISYAHRVGFLGADCIMDWVSNPFTSTVVYANTWKCDYAFATLSPSQVAPSVSLDVTSQNEPVIAYQVCDADYCGLHVRSGNSAGELIWIKDVIVDQGGPTNFGRGASLTLNNRDLGFIGYLEDMDTEANLKTAQQLYALYLPLTLR
jgi:hypothetical protein